MQKVNGGDLNTLNDALHYLKMNELKNVCQQYELEFQGNKVALIARIITFLSSGQKLQAQKIPLISTAQKAITYPLEPNTHMLYKAYKNDAKTRAFFKTLIGPHFHFTAFGIDWLNAMWLAGTPPTYAEFAQYWQKEYTARQHTKATPKKEWAYINFTQRLLQQHPDASKDTILAAWQNERLDNVKIIEKLLKIKIRTN